MGGLEDNLQWEKFKLQHEKVYPLKDEEEVRKDVFRTNLRKIEAHNEREEKGLETWRMAVTQFADLTEKEFEQQMLGGYVRTPQSSGGHAKREVASDLPASVDWREKGVITEPKNQGSCGSCWAFATVETIESYAAINNVSLTKLSTQEVTTCTPNPLHCGGTGGCRGSIPQLGYNYVQLFGLATNDEYPYWSGVTGMTGNCKYDLERRTPSCLSNDTHPPPKPPPPAYPMTPTLHPDHRPCLSQHTHPLPKPPPLPIKIHTHKHIYTHA